MERQPHNNLFSLPGLYEAAQQVYSALPYHFFKGGRAFPPWHLYIEVTRRCNLRCAMCQYIDWLEHEPAKVQREGELSTEEWCRVIDQIRSFSLVTFTGGEPFLRRDFPELLARASHRARTHFISNGTLIPEAFIPELAALAPKRLGGRGLNFIGMSIEGPRERHDAIRRKEGGFDLTCNTIRSIVEERERTGKQCPRIHMTTVIQADNVELLPEMPQVAQAAGVEVLNLVTETRMFALPGLGEVDPATYTLDQVPYPRIDAAALEKALADTERAAVEAGIELRLPRLPRAELVRYYSEPIDLRHYRCRNAWNTLFIGRQGDVYPCLIKKVGNVREDSLKTIWNNPDMRRFRQACTKGLFAPCPGCCFIEYK